MKNVSQYGLLHSLSEGKRQAYEEIFKLYWVTVYHYISTVIGPAHASAAEDLSQNVFLKLWIRRESLPGIKSLDAWLFTMSCNEARDFLRHEKVAGKYAARVELSDNYIDKLDLRYDYDLIASAIESCVQKMPARRRDVWRLSREEHIDNAGIAAKLGLSARTVERHISLALKDIRAALEKVGAA